MHHHVQLLLAGVAVAERGRHRVELVLRRRHHLLPVVRRGQHRRQLGARPGRPLQRAVPQFAQAAERLAACAHKVALDALPLLEDDRRPLCRQGRRERQLDLRLHHRAFGRLVSRGLRRRRLRGRHLRRLGILLFRPGRRLLCRRLDPSRRLGGHLGLALEQRLDRLADLGCDGFKRLLGRDCQQHIELHQPAAKRRLSLGVGGEGRTQLGLGAAAAERHKPLLQPGLLRRRVELHVVHGTGGRIQPPAEGASPGRLVRHVQPKHQIEPRRRAHLSRRLVGGRRGQLGLFGLGGRRLVGGVPSEFLLEQLGLGCRGRV
mmetsp:Transcript_5764/g.19108  ORF Transcript_5764/g.19108 Transcript_5764/m.19108 type:complete len:318 (-) Transcript_5764:1889-2842(-)